ncbi:histidine kinase [Virgisporangium aliadipatigenens]|uniref:histidine kinase n=1 Tax=Virgisporangium aliadipatigenens TaxID=741659 RepID=A0A8J3YGZ3_9ACTN|nr:nitrate- and nitrite sensing domain-containing protein [Virgisporangium aliadipatigenens]GIJ44028.1 histidine kinase [Virgisporangium aliadipatigenens]
MRRDVIRLVFIPGLVALALWFVASGFLVSQGFYNRAVADSVRTVSIPAVPALTSVLMERRMSVALLAKPQTDPGELSAQRRLTDQKVAALREAATGALALAPDSIVSRWRKLSGELDQLPRVRGSVDDRSGTGQTVYAFYNTLLDTATDLFNTQALVVPDVTASQGGLTAVEAFRISDRMTRAATKLDGAFAAGAFGAEDYLEFVVLVGGYRTALATISPQLRPAARAGYDRLVAGDAWRELAAAESAIVTAGVWRGAVPASLTALRDRWQELTRPISEQLIAITIDQADEVSSRALRTGNRQLLAASLGSVVALSVTIAAIGWAIRRSRELPLRLARLGTDAATLVDQRLPTMLEQLRRGEKLEDATIGLPLPDYGRDEIGRMAAVINRSLQAASGAAMDEAKTRVAGTAMLMGIARRPQRPVQRGLKVIESLQHQVGDENVLRSLFDLNHQLTQTRRFLENLVILAGGQIGRRFRDPVPVQRVLLAAFAESQQYQRISLRRAPDVAIAGPSVAETIHLLAELLDNAVTFSRPDTTVWVTCMEVSHGVAVEIEDAGVGMLPDALQRANGLLATAPVPDVRALKDGAQVGLYVVAELAKRSGITVTLRPSVYGGVQAIVLLPDRLVTPIAEDAPTATVERTPVPAPAPRPADGAVRPAVGIAASEAPPELSVNAPAEPATDGTGGAARETRPAEPSVSPDALENSDRPVLPRRAPQQHLVAALRDEPARTDPPPAANAERSPEAARERFSRYQRAMAAGKAAGRQENATGEEGGPQ